LEYIDGKIQEFEQALDSKQIWKAKHHFIDYFWVDAWTPVVCNPDRPKYNIEPIEKKM